MSSGLAPEELLITLIKLATPGTGILLFRGKRWDFAELNPACVPLLITG